MKCENENRNDLAEQEAELTDEELDAASGGVKFGKDLNYSKMVLKRESNRREVSKPEHAI